MTFLPCPYCGRKLTTDDLRFFDEESYLGDMEMIHDFDHILDPSNSAWPSDWEGVDEEDRQNRVEFYREVVETVEDIQLHCPCGASVFVNRWKTRFPEEGWLEEFEDAVNRRSVKAMETTLKRIIDHACGGPVRQRYMDALIALMEIEKMRKEGQEAWGNDDSF